jgi:hypothetical protein
LRLIQIKHPEQGRRVAQIQDGRCLLLTPARATVHGLAGAAVRSGRSLAEEVENCLTDADLDYDPIYRGEDDWKLLVPFDHPAEPSRCLVSGTGLTHKASVDNRQAMHEESGTGEVEITDSMRIYQWGLEGGKPGSGSIGVQPEWFYKGCGTILRAHGEALEVPAFADDGGEEPEIAGAYFIDPGGQPRRVGLMVGNEFSDHTMEKKNYLYLAPCKLRTCSVGPELHVDASFGNLTGTVSVERSGETVWSRSVVTGEDNMSHSLENLEHHHFKYDAHRRPGDAHIHFFGADGFSFGEGFRIEDGDITEVAWEGFGKPLRNPVRIAKGPESFQAALPV